MSVQSLHCSFCEKSSSDVKKLLEGASAYICDECVQICYEVVNEKKIEPLPKKLIDKKSIPSPRKIKEHLDNYIIGQNEAKETVAVAVYNHYKRLAHPVIDNVEIEKSNILLLGPTGCGKTLFAKSIAKFIDVPFAIADATSLTEAGYVGDDVESIITRLLQAADFDVEKAQKGIIYLDEIDKKARRGETASGAKDVSGEGVQQGLLKLLEGSEVFVSATGGRKSVNSETYKVNTSNILFICGGAFVGIDEIVKKLQNKSQAKIGFNSVSYEEQSINDSLSKVEPEHITAYGLIPELVGRLPVIATLKELDENSLFKVLTEPKNAVTKQFVNMFKLDHIDLEFETAALEEIVKLSIKRKTGARGLRGVIEQKLSKVQYDLPEMHEQGVKKIIITKEMILKNTAPIMIYGKKEKNKLEG